MEMQELDGMITGAGRENISGGGMEEDMADATR